MDWAALLFIKGFFIWTDWNIILIHYLVFFCFPDAKSFGFHRKLLQKIFSSPTLKNILEEISLK